MTVLLNAVLAACKTSGTHPTIRLGMLLVVSRCNKLWGAFTLIKTAIDLFHNFKSTSPCEFFLSGRKAHSVLLSEGGRGSTLPGICFSILSF